MYYLIILIESRAKKFPNDQKFNLSKTNILKSHTPEFQQYNAILVPDSCLYSLQGAFLQIHINCINSQWSQSFTLCKNSNI